MIFVFEREEWGCEEVGFVLVFSMWGIGLEIMVFFGGYLCGCSVDVV